MVESDVCSVDDEDGVDLHEGARGVRVGVASVPSLIHALRNMFCRFKFALSSRQKWQIRPDTNQGFVLEAGTIPSTMGKRNFGSDSPRGSSVSTMPQVADVKRPFTSVCRMAVAGKNVSRHQVSQTGATKR